MAISKNERRLSIWIGITIGIALSSMLVRYALQKKTQQTNDRPGNYKSLACASNGTPFDPIPEQITEHIPHGIVIYFENNQSNLKWNKSTTEKSWTIESAGSFRSERLFVLAKRSLPLEIKILINNIFSTELLNFIYFLLKQRLWSNSKN